MPRNKKRAVDPEFAYGGKKRKETPNSALLNPEILEILFKSLDPPRLKLFRTVCRSWNEEICRGMRKRGFVSYARSQGKYSALMGVVKRSRELGLPQPFKTLVLRVGDNNMLIRVNSSVPLQLPIAKLCVAEGLFGGCPAWGNRLYTLLRTCSSTLTTLKIHVCSSAIPQAPDGTISSKLLEFPLLEELAITVKSHEYRPFNPDAVRLEREKETQAMTFFANLINSAPKLSSLDIDPGASGEFKDFLRRLDLDKMKQIKRLKMSRDFKMSGAGNPAVIKFDNLTSFSISGEVKLPAQDSYVQELLQRNSGSLRSLSIGTGFASPLPLCPNLEHFAVQKFPYGHYYLDLTSFPAVRSVVIGHLSWSLRGAILACPASVKTVKICGGEEVSRIRFAFRNLLGFFASSATTWELPVGYVEEFCAFFGDENQLETGNGVSSLTINLEPGGESTRTNNLLPLPPGLGNLWKLGDLRELILNNNKSEIDSQTWSSLQLESLASLHTLSYFKHTDLAEFTEELPSELLPLRRVVLLRNKPAAFGRKTEEFFSKFPNVTCRFERGALE